MYSLFPPEIIALIESFHTVPYWKNRFDQDVLPCLDKGWRLVCTQSNEIPCYECYHTGKCFYWDYESQSVHMSYEQFSRQNWYKYLTYAQYKKIRSAKYIHSSLNNSHHWPMMLQCEIKLSKVYQRYNPISPIELNRIRYIRQLLACTS